MNRLNDCRQPQRPFTEIPIAGPYLYIPQSPAGLAARMPINTQRVSAQYEAETMQADVRRHLFLYLNALQGANHEKPLLALIGVVLFDTTLPVVAEPNWALIEDGRKIQATRMHRGLSNETTTGQRESKKAKIQKMMKECQTMMSKGE